MHRSSLLTAWHGQCAYLKALADGQGDEQIDWSPSFHSERTTQQSTCNATLLRWTYRVPFSSVSSVACKVVSYACEGRKGSLYRSTVLAIHAALVHDQPALLRSRHADILQWYLTLPWLYKTLTGHQLPLSPLAPLTCYFFDSGTSCTRAWRPARWAIAPCFGSTSSAGGRCRFAHPYSLIRGATF
jgi:hypothetical protein